MKRMLTLALLGMFTAGLSASFGCHAEGELGDNDTSTSTSSGSSYSKKTTTVKEPDGDTSTKTEVRRSSGY
jgi:hypothetical protein